MAGADSTADGALSQPVYIYGSGRLTSSLLAFLARRQVPIAGVIRAPGDGGLPCGDAEPPRSLSVGDYQRETAEAREAPILIGALDQADDGDRFLDLLEQASAFAWPEAPVLHPSALVPLASDTHIDGLFALLGFPGSGNRIVQAILTHLYHHHLQPRQRLTGEQRFLREAAHGHTASVESYVRRRLGYYDGLQVRATRGNVGNAQGPIRILQNVRVAYRNGDFAFMKDLHSQSYFGHYFTGHLVPQDALLAFLERMSYRTFVVVRHPLDVIVSCAAKTARPPQLLIDKDEWFDRIAGNLAATLQETDKQRDRVHLIRYEDLISDPAPRIRGIAEALGVELTDAEVDEIWEAYGFKSVTPAGGVHLWRPGAGKFREYLRKAHWQKLVEAGVQEAARAHGYDFAAEDFSDRAPMTLEDIDPDRDDVEVPDKFFGKVDRTTAHDREIPGTSVKVMSNHAWLAEGVAQALGNPAFQRLVVSAQLPGR